MSNVEDKVYFHPEQVKYIEKLFPERSFPHTVSNDELRHYNGQRTVVEAIRARKRA